MRRDPLRIVVAGMVADVPRQGGWVWALMHWVVGLRRLGHDVLVVEPVETLAPETVRGSHYIARAFGLTGRSALLTSSGATSGVDYRELVRFASDADLLVNVAGVLTHPEIFERIGIRAYLDVDPGFTQLWHESGLDMRLRGHTHFLTVGLNLGRPDCAVPTAGVDWRTTLPPVVLEAWEPAQGIRDNAWTTVAHWRGYGSIEHGGVRYGQKAHSWRELLTLPALSGRRFAPALAIHPDERADRAALHQHGWELADPRQVASTPGRYRRFLRESFAELAVAKEGYVVTGGGWFSDRSACYLAAGRPVVSQDTGWTRVIAPSGGLLPFRSVEEAADAVAQVHADYDRHARLARMFAEECLAAHRVLPHVLEVLR